MKFDLIEMTKEIISAIGVGIVSWAIWGGLMNLYKFTQTGVFKLSSFFISIAIWWFVGYLAWEFTQNGAILWVSWALSMKIFDLVNDKWILLLKKFVEKKFNINLDDYEEKNK